LELGNRTVPTWALKFRCKVIRDDVPKDVLQRIAGREQAKAVTVTGMSFTDTVVYFKSLVDGVVQAAQAAGTEVVINRTDLLKKTYENTGKTTKFDGTMACSLAPALEGAHCLHSDSRGTQGSRKGYGLLKRWVIVLQCAGELMSFPFSSLCSAW
jgi:hypothetical protein